MKRFLWTTLFWIVVVIAFIIYAKWYNQPLAMQVANMFYSSEQGTGDMMAVDTGVNMVDMKLDMILSGLDTLIMMEQNDAMDDEDTMTSDDTETVPAATTNTRTQTTSQTDEE